MIKKIIVCFGLLLSLAALGQEGTASPYSYYGIGDVRFKGASENRFMGGLSVQADSIHINFQNPAAYSRLKYTTFTVAGSFHSYQFKTSNPTEKAQRTTLDYLAVGLPIGKKFGASFGLIPYSSVGYKIRQEFIDISGNTVGTLQTGTGGMNKVFVGLGYKINNYLSVGLDFNYNFGTITSFSNTQITNLQSGTLESKSSNLSGLNFNIGMMYQRKITSKLDAYSSVTFAPQSNLNFDNTNILSLTGLGQYDVAQSITTSNEKKIKLPSKISFGLGVGQQRKWLVGAEVTTTNNAGFGNRFGDVSQVSYKNGTKLSLGGYFIPNYNSFKSYFDKVTYRGGFRYENTGLVINNQSIKEQAFTLGLGLPLGGTFSNLNIGAEFGKRGTAKANLVQENFLNIIMSLSLNDLWFVKRKYD